MSQRGWLTKEERKRAGKVWVYHNYKTRDTDGHRVENTVVVGALSSLPREKDAWAEVEHRGLNRKHELGLPGRVMFGDLARHYIKYELGELAEADDQKSHTTIERYLQILNNRLIPRWGNRPALEVEPLEIMQWLKASKRMENLENPTVDKIRRVMNLVFKHGQTYGLIPRGNESQSDEVCSGEDSVGIRGEDHQTGTMLQDSHGNASAGADSHTPHRGYGASHFRVPWFAVGRCGLRQPAGFCPSLVDGRQDWQAKECGEQGSRSIGPATRRLHSPVAGADTLRSADGLGVCQHPA